MKLVVPVTIGEAHLVSSNVPERLPSQVSAVSYSQWSAATTYAAAAEVCWVYESEDGDNQFLGVFTSRYASNLNREPAKRYPDGGATLPGFAYWAAGASAPDWKATITYGRGQVVGRISGGSGAFYESLQAGNVNQDPATASAWWRQTTADSYETWAGGTTYGLGARVSLFAGTRGSLFRSLQAANTGNNPANSPAWWAYEGDSFKTWTSTASYAVGETVIDLRTHRAYEALQAMTSGAGAKDPTKAVNAAFWLDLGLNARWAMFDDSVSSQSRAGERIDVTLAPGAACDTLALMNLAAAKAWISASRLEAVNRNKLTWTESFDNAAWVKASGVTVSADATVAPDGETTADRVSWAGAATGTGVQRAGIPISGVANVKSVWLRADTPGGTIELCDPVSLAAIRSHTLTTAWQRVVLAEVAGAQPANGGLWLRKTASSPASFDVWGAQLELGAQVTAYQPVAAAYLGREVLYAAMFDLADPSFITDWRRYFFDPVTTRADLIVTDLPLYADAQIRAIVTRPGQAVAVGAAVLGRAVELGVTLLGASNGIRDYSRKEFDTFGNASFVERGYAKTAQMQVAVSPAQYDAVMQLLADRRAKPSLWIGTGKYAGLWILGIAREHRGEVSNHAASYLTLDIEGLV